MVDLPPRQNLVIAFPCHVTRGHFEAPETADPFVAGVIRLVHFRDIGPNVVCRTLADNVYFEEAGYRALLESRYVHAIVRWNESTAPGRRFGPDETEPPAFEAMNLETRFQTSRHDPRLVSLAADCGAPPLPTFGASDPRDPLEFILMHRENYFRVWDVVAMQRWITRACAAIFWRGVGQKERSRIHTNALTDPIPEAWRSTTFPHSDEPMIEETEARAGIYAAHIPTGDWWSEVRQVANLRDQQLKERK